jgi:hypothetical protein
MILELRVPLSATTASYLRDLPSDGRLDKSSPTHSIRPRPTFPRKAGEGKEGADGHFVAFAAREATSRLRAFASSIAATWRIIIE